MTLVLLVLFSSTFIGQIATGLREHNEDQIDHGQPTLSLGQYLKSGHFLGVTGGTWASEFLQMGIFVLLSARLNEKGSPEARSDDDDNDDDEDDDECDDPRAPWPVRQGGWIKWLYSHSLSLAFLLLFALTFVLHGYGGALEYSAQEQLHGGSAVSMREFMASSRFWFEALQNWQSAFLSLVAMVTFLVYLRERGAAVSKRVAAAYDDDD
jgi:hypothetical protein